MSKGMRFFFGQPRGIFCHPDRRIKKKWLRLDEGVHSAVLQKSKPDVEAAARMGIGLASGVDQDEAVDHVRITESKIEADQAAERMAHEAEALELQPGG